MEIDHMKYNNILLVRERIRINDLTSNIKLAELWGVDRRKIPVWLKNSDSLDDIPVGKMRMLCKILGLSIEEVMYFKNPIEVRKYLPAKKQPALSRAEIELIGLDGKSKDGELSEFFGVGVKMIQEIRQNSTRNEEFSCLPIHKID